MTRFARPAGSFLAGSSAVQMRGHICRTPVGASHSPLSADAKKPAFSCGLFSKYGGEGGIDSLRSPCGQLPRRLVSCPDAQAHLSNPGRGFSSPLSADAKKPAFSCGLFSKYGGEGGIDSLRSPCGQLPRRLVSCPDAQAHLSNPGRGFSSPLSADAKKPAFSRGLFLNMAVRGGFEPPIRCRIHTFQACSFSHSDTSPYCFAAVP